MKVPLIEFKDVYKRYGDKVVLSGVNLKVYPGEITTIIGKSGVGKSVTLKLMIGLDRPDKGEIFYRGEPLSSMSKKHWMEVKKDINFMFQNNALFDSLTIYENIALPLHETTNLSESKIRKRVQGVMDALEIQGQEDKYPSQLSGGMQKRVALARAIITDPKIVLFDEPTTGLDPIRRNSVLSMITNKQKEFGFTAVLVSHDVPHVFYISNRIAVIDEGKIVFEGDPKALENSDHPVVYEFINSLEFLKNEVVGLMTKRDFEKFFKKLCQKGNRDLMIVVYEINNYNDIIEKVGHITPYIIFSELASMCRNSCGDRILGIGKYGIDKIVSIVDATQVIDIDKQLSLIARQLQDKEFFQEQAYTNSCVEFAVYAGYTNFDPHKSLNELVDEARRQRLVMGRLLCGKKQQG